MQTGAKTIKDIETSLTGHIYTFVIKYSIDRTIDFERNPTLSFMNMDDQYPPAPIVRPDLLHILIMSPAVFMLLSLNLKLITFTSYLVTGGRLLCSRLKKYSLGLRLLAGITFIGLLAALNTRPQNLNIWAYHGNYDLFVPRVDAQAQVGGTVEDANVTSWAL